MLEAAGPKEIANSSVCRDTGLGRKKEAGRPSPTGSSSVTERPLSPVTWALGLAGPQGAATALCIDRAQRGHGPAQACTARQWQSSGLLLGPGPHPGLLLHPDSRLRLSRQEEWPPGAHTPGWTQAERGWRAAPTQHPVPSGCERSWTRSDLLSMVVICPGNKPRLLHECRCHGNHESGPHFAQPDT